MYDSVTSRDIPVGAAMVAGYLDGRDAWTLQDWQRHANAIHVYLVIDPTNPAGHCIDIEPGNAGPEGAVLYVQRGRAVGVQRSVYCIAGEPPYTVGPWADVRAAFRAAHEPEPPYWVAAWGPSRIIPPGAVALQFANPDTSGGHYDLSVVADFWPGVDTTASPPPEDLPMDQETRNTFKKLTVATAAATLTPLLTDADLDAIWPLVHDNFDNLQAVLAQLVAAHPRPIPDGAHVHK